MRRGPGLGGSSGGLGFGGLVRGASGGVREETPTDLFVMLSDSRDSSFAAGIFEIQIRLAALGFRRSLSCSHKPFAGEFPVLAVDSIRSAWPPSMAKEFLTSIYSVSSHGQLYI